MMAGAFQESCRLPMIDLAAEMSACSGDGPGSLFALKEDEIRSQEKTAGSQNGLDLNNAGLCRHLESEKTEDRITEGHKAEEEKESSVRSQRMRAF